MFSSDLAKVAASTARSTVVLAGEGGPDEVDCRTLRTVLSLLSLKSGLQGHIVAEMRDVDNEVLVQMVGVDSVDTVVSHDLVGRLMLMSARQPGLARVYSSVLGFEGDEFYMAEWPEITGTRFGDLQLRFPEATPIGVHNVANGSIVINPARHYVMQDGEELLVIAEDDDTYRPEDMAEVHAGELPVISEKPVGTEKILLCGWRRDVRDVLLLINEMVVAQSEVHILCEMSMWERNASLRAAGLDVNDLVNISLVHHVGDSAARRHLSQLPVEK